jgi:DNA gyrase/topoisomerase IV subunit A
MLSGCGKAKDTIVFENSTIQMSKEESTKVGTPLNKSVEFIFPDSDKVIINSTELENCDKFTLLLAKNEIFARKGYRFKDKDLFEYFSNMSWYKPMDNVKGTLEELNAVEKENFNLLDRSYKSFSQSYFNNLEAKDNKKYEQSIEKDINNDGAKEKISVLFEGNEENYLDNYIITVSSKGKDYKIKGEETNLNSGLFFADFNIDDNFTEFYITSNGPSDDPRTSIFRFNGDSIVEIMKLEAFITSYNGNGKIYTEFSKTNDKNKILISYYELGKGVVHPDKKDVIGSYLQYDSNFKLFKTGKEGMSGIAIKDDEDLNKFIAEQTDKDQIVKVTKRNEKLRIVDVDYEAYSRFNVETIRNIPIKVEAEDGKQGWLMWLNGGD